MPTPYADQLLMYPVPARFVPDVTDLLTRLAEKHITHVEAPDTIEKVPDGISPSSEYDWAEADLRKLLPLLYPQNRVALAVLDLAAEKPDTLVSYPDACIHAGVDISKGKAGVGALTKVCRKIGHEHWPVSYHWSEGGENLSYYRMTKITAERWLKVRADHS